MLRFPRVIYFIAGSVPTDAERKEASALGANVVFRNASLIAPENSLEDCAGVAGAVPASYKEKPDALTVISKFLTGTTGAKSPPIPPIPPVPTLTTSAPTANGGEDWWDGTNNTNKEDV